MATITLKPKQVTKKILSDLNERAHDVILNRFGLGSDPERKTLEAIGNTYGITRERVRQIENAALIAIRKSEAFQAERRAFEELRDIVDSLGAIVVEDELLSFISKDKQIQNHVNLFLVLGDDFTRHKEDDYFEARWSVDETIATQIQDALERLYEELSIDEIVAENEMIARFLDQVKDVADRYKNEEIARRWLSISRTVGKNPLGEWGRASSSNIRTKGVKDYAFLVMRKHGSPMHFTEVAKTICDVFDKETNSATCHNELIKDARFVLVGRGTYGLTEWGYKPGIVREVIRDILKEKGPLSKEEVIDLMMKERFLKRNTILVNLQNQEYFKKTKEGLYKAI